MVIIKWFLGNCLFDPNIYVSDYFLASHVLKISSLISPFNVFHLKTSSHRPAVKDSIFASQCAGFRLLRNRLEAHVY